MDAIALRPAVVDDREFLFRLHEAAMGPLVEELFGPWDEAEQWEFFDRWFRPERVWVITAGGVDVGVIGVEDRREDVYITRIEVMPAWQGRGVATFVMRQVLGRAHAEGRPVSLHVFSANRARGWYERLGFAEVVDEHGRRLMRADPG